MAGYNYYPQSYGNPYMQNYFPQTYQPMQQPMQQQIPQQMPQQMPGTQPSQQNTMPTGQNSIIWVTGLEEAQKYPVAPNGAVVLWEQTGKTIFVKQSDATGRPTLTIYDLVERTETAQNGVSQTGGTSPEYVTKREFEALCATVEEIKTKSEKRAAARRRELADDE